MLYKESSLNEGWAKDICYFGYLFLHCICTVDCIFFPWSGDYDFTLGMEARVQGFLKLLPQITCLVLKQLYFPFLSAVLGMKAEWTVNIPVRTHIPVHSTHQLHTSAWEKPCLNHPNPKKGFEELGAGDRQHVMPELVRRTRPSGSSRRVWFSYKRSAAPRF